MHKKLKTLTAAVLLCCAPLVASASVINFDFSTAGNVSLTSDGAELNGTTATSGLESLFGGSSPTFTFNGLFNLIGPFGAIGVPPDGGWSMSDAAGDSLFGSFSAAFIGGLDAFFYNVAGGTGILYGAQGNGGSLVGFGSDGQYREQGTMVIAVPEPGMISLFFAGLLALGCAVRRQRREGGLLPSNAG